MLFTNSPHHEMTGGPIPKSRLDRGNPIAAGGYDRLDELAVGVFVATIDELREAEVSIRAFVVNAGEVEGADRIVRRPNEKDAMEAAGGALERVTKSSGFE